MPVALLDSIICLVFDTRPRPPAIDWELATMALMPHDIRWAFFNSVMGDLTPLLELLGCLSRPDNIQQWCQQKRLTQK